MDVAAWLEVLGLERYAPLFREHEIDWEVLPKLTSEDLKELGVLAIGHRRKLLNAVAALSSSVPASAVTAAASDAATPGIAERRQLTVMFCDLVGSTSLSGRLDPEDLREIIGAYHRAVAEVIQSFGGFVAKYMGDGVLAYFGYPRAHEDDAERAVRAGLGVIEAVARLDVKSVKLQARIGIATGLVVVGDLIGEGSAQEQSVVGETPNLAARLQALADPDAVVIGGTTRRLVGNLFECHNLGAIEVKGIAAPVSSWQVLRPSAVESRFVALRGSALSPLVGRGEELDLLMRRWARAKGGEGQVVLISGEPGIGKSRLTAELEQRLNGEPHLCLRYSCSSYHQESALNPFTEQFGRTAGFTGDDPPALRLEKLEALLARSALPHDDVALLADLMSLPASDRHPLPNLSSQRKKELTLDALVRHLEGLARRQPVIVVFEDAHWSDPTSRELLDLTVERIGEVPVLLIVTFRPEFQPPWTGQPQVTMLALNRLDRRERSALVAQIVGDKTLPDEVIHQIADRTDGVPLFIEELTKSVLESGFRLMGIPTTLHDSLMARLDRLASVRLVAQIGAAIGREFSYTLLRAVSQLPEHELQAALGRLAASELVFQRGTPPDAVYSFKHALVQDAAHSSLLRTTRQKLHSQIADALETQSPELMDTQPELFAQHYAEAGLAETSAIFWGKAGHRSAGRSAMAEAAAQFRSALNQLAQLPDNPERRRQRLELLSARGAALMATRGIAAPETGQAYGRARELWEQLGSPPEFLQVAHGQSFYHMVRGELSLAQRLAEDLLRRSGHRDNSASLVLGHSCLGRTLMLTGRFVSSRSHLDEALALYDPISHPSLAQQLGIHPENDSTAVSALVLFCLGYPDRALARSHAAVADAQGLAHPPTLASSLFLGAKLLSLIGDNPALDRRAERLIALATEQRFPLWHAYGTICRGWIKVKSGCEVAGLALLRAGLTDYRATGGETYMPHHIDLLARACAIIGQIEEALSLLDDALQIVERTGERWFSAELNRHKGELLLRQGDFAAAEDFYRNALNIAREQEAKLWELRAAVSLARLHHDQGRRAEARDLLALVYGWFTEGFNTADLKEARALLDELT